MVVLTRPSLSSLQTTNIIIILQFSKSNLQKLSTPPPSQYQKPPRWSLPPRWKKCPDGPNRPDGKKCPDSKKTARMAPPARMAKKQSAKKAVSHAATGLLPPQKKPHASMPIILPQISAAILFSSKHISLVRGIRWF